MSPDNKNLFAAIALSIAVLVGWQYFIGAPLMDKQRREAKLQASPRTGTPTNPEGEAPAPGPKNPSTAIVVPGAAAPNRRPREEVLATTARTPIATEKLAGSISLKGGRIDDISLLNYHETIDPKSPNIVLLSPAGSNEPFYAEFGFVNGVGQDSVLPGADTLWTAPEGAKLTIQTPVTLSWSNGNGLTFKRKISVDQNYLFTIEDAVENNASSPVTLHSYALVSRRGHPALSGYAVLHEGLLGLVGDSSLEELTYAKIEKEHAANPKRISGQGGWLGFTDKYWAAVVAPDPSQTIDATFAANMSGGAPARYQADYVATPQTIAAGAASKVKHYLFAGAKVSEIVDNYQVSPGLKKFELMIDWGYFYFFTRPLFKLIDYIFRLVGNFGVAILITTVLVKLAFLPLANRSYMSMAKMKAIQPQIKALQERYKDDKLKIQQEQMELFKREKINPVAGCLPMLLQIPVFFALYKVIFVTIEMRHAPFFGWIHDLSAPDPTNVFTLFGLIPFDPTQIPLFGQFLWLGVWPLLMGVSMWVQMKMNPEATDPVQRQMFAWMPVIFTFMLGSFPAGLVIYWTWNNTLSVCQQWWIMKRAGAPFELWTNLKKTFDRKQK